MAVTTKDTVLKMKKFAERHKDECLWGLKLVRDEALLAEIREAIVKKAYDVHEEKVRYEEALDYASK